MSTYASQLASQLLQSEGIGLKGRVLAVVFGVIAVTALSVYFSDRPYDEFPMFHGKGVSVKTIWQAKQRWITSAKKILTEGCQTTKPFQVVANMGPLIILHPSKMNEVRNDDRMTFRAWLKQHFFTTYPGFNGFVPAATNDVFVKSVRMGLTQTLGRATEILDEETKVFLSENYPYSEEWREIHLDHDAARMIARLSTVIFMPELARNEEWLKIAVNYTVHFFTGAYVLRMIPPPFRPLVHWFLPFTRQLRKDVAEARRLIMPLVNKRKKEEAEAMKAGIPYEKPIDALQWVETTAESTGLYCDPVYGQLNFTLGAVHTTSVTLTNTVYDLLARPEYIGLLLEEIKTESEGGKWTKGTLGKLKLMDSFMKESTRLTPVTMLPFNRVAEETFTLSDGTTIPKGATLGIPTLASNDPAFYPEPTKFDGYRFLNLSKEPGGATKHGFVSTSNEHIIFGHGKHACPGRFFASNEIKIILIHLLSNYELKFKEKDGKKGVRPKPMEMGADLVPNPETTIFIRSKKGKYVNSTEATVEL